MPAATMPRRAEGSVTRRGYGDGAARAAAIWLNVSASGATKGSASGTVRDDVEELRRPGRRRAGGATTGSARRRAARTPSSTSANRPRSVRCSQGESNVAHADHAADELLLGQLVEVSARARQDRPERVDGEQGRRALVEDARRHRVVVGRGPQRPRGAVADVEAVARRERMHPVERDRPRRAASAARRARGSPASPSAPGPCTAGGCRCGHRRRGSARSTPGRRDRSRSGAPR